MHAPGTHAQPTEPLAVELPVRDEAGAKAGRRHVDRLTLREVIISPSLDEEQRLVFVTDAGEISARYHATSALAGMPSRAVIWLGGAGGGLDGPAAGLYPAACRALQRRGVAGLRVDYRRPNDLTACILDALLATTWLQGQAVARVAVAGHSFGGAVALSAGALSGHVTAVVTLATQTYGADLAGAVSPRPLLLIHGTDDEILPHVCSELVFAAAAEPKELKLFPGARHGLDAAREELLPFLVDWLERNT